jgi:uncharacterized phage-like protein YoqJ
VIGGVTGHRGVQQKPGELDRFARLFVALSGAEKMISGMALGWDIAVAKACIDLEVPLIAAVPFPQQADRWPMHDHILWLQCLNAAERVNIGGPAPDSRLYLDRNKWIVDQCDELHSLYDGRPRGGTRHCVLYAEAAKVKIVPLWDRWQRFRAEGLAA